MIHDILQNGWKRIGILNFYRRSTFDIKERNVPIGMVPHYLQKWFEEFDIELVLEEVEGVDAVIVQPYRYLLMGGVWSTLYNTQLIERFTRKCNVPVYVIYEDPQVWFENPYFHWNRGIRTIGEDHIPWLTEPEDYDRFMNKDWRRVQLCRNPQQFVEGTKLNGPHTILPTDSQYLPLTERMIIGELKSVKQRLLPKTVADCDWDVVYWGSNRGGQRFKTLNELFKSDEDLKKLWIGPPINWNSVDQKPKMKRGELEQWVTRSKASVIVGDPQHNDNVPTYRLFETLQWNTIGMIHTSFDSMGLYYPEWSYFTTLEDLKTRLEWISTQDYSSLIEEQRVHLMGYAKEVLQNFLVNC